MDKAVLIMAFAVVCKVRFVDFLPFPLVDHKEGVGDMFGVEFFEGSVVMLFKGIYLVSFLFILSSSEFYEIGGSINIVGITLNYPVGTFIEKTQEGFINVIDIRFKAAGIINFSHHGKTFIQGVLNVVFSERWEHHAHALGCYSKEAKIVID